MLLAVATFADHHSEESYHSHPKYEFKYGVKDTHTHDIKEQSEKRDGHKVEGHYKLVEPDGTTRTVHYTADKHTGFHAHVERHGHAVHPIHHQKKIELHEHKLGGSMVRRVRKYRNVEKPLAILTSVFMILFQHHIEEHHHAHPKYEFKYGVKDEHTHDIKEQAEKRDGHKVEGYYKLVEPDGTTRTVHYTADKHTGFHAHVERSGHAVHPVHHHH
ncbi:hypothetical protein L9F63_022453 [Diploptera punctata]|uniref:Uncharacterized protein n=1 Tax=Diploptera punctata TaxID=6984 RepID=A0AAD7ZMQ3_DIPPU|nr:hypothetical protein L9F63_022453 [Diploptera punctata]